MELNKLNKAETIKSACDFYNYKWPKDLWTGVMFFKGQKITIKEFNIWARNFK